MISVYVWNFRGKNVAWGHASMAVNGGIPSGIVYISWWPKGASSRRVLDATRTHLTVQVMTAQWLPREEPRLAVAEHVVSKTDLLYCAPAIESRTYEDDKRDKRGHPDHVVSINGLDEMAVKEWWTHFRLNPQSEWCSVGPGPNCSAVVAMALKAGGARKYTRSFSGWFSGNRLIWTPDYVLRYALAIQKGLQASPQK